MLGFSALSAENMPKEVFPQLEVHCRRTLTVPATFFSDTHSLSGLLAGPSAAVGERQIQAIAYDPNRQLGLGDAATQTAALQYKDVTAGSSRKHPDGWVSFAQWADLRAKHWVSDPTDYQTGRSDVCGKGWNPANGVPFCARAYICRPRPLGLAGWLWDAGEYVGRP